MAWKIYDKVSRQYVELPPFETEGKAWEALKEAGGNWDEYSVVNEQEQVQRLDEAEALSNQANELAQNPNLPWEDMTFGEKASSFVLPMTAEASRRGASPEEINAWREADENLMMLGGAIPLAGKIFSKPLAKVGAPLLGEVALGAGLASGMDIAGNRPVSAENMTIGGIFGLAPRVLRKSGEKVLQGGRYVLGEVLGSTSTAGRDALEAYATKAGREKIAGVAGQGPRIAGELIETMQAPAPEQAMVTEMLERIGDVDISPALQALENSKIKPSGGRPLFDWEVTANEAIEGKIQEMRGRATGMAKTKYSAKAVNELKKGLDENINYDVGPDAKKITRTVNNALKSARVELKNGLESSAVASGVPEYPTVMKDYANRMQALQGVREAIGGAGMNQTEKAERLLNNLFTGSKSERKKAIETFSDIYGKDFMEQAQFLDYARRLGVDATTGKPAWLPTMNTGARLLGPVTAGATTIGSMLAGGDIKKSLSMAMLPLLGGSPRGASALLSGLNKIQDIYGIGTRYTGGLPETVAKQMTISDYMRK